LCGYCTITQKRKSKADNWLAQLPVAYSGFDARLIYGYNMPVSVSRSLFFCVER
jgi:hypothetical protein